MNKNKLKQSNKKRNSTYTYKKKISKFGGIGSHNTSSEDYPWNTKQFNIDVDNLVNSLDSIDQPKGFNEIVLEQSGPPELPVPYDWIGIDNPHWENDDNDNYGQFMELGEGVNRLKKTRKYHKKKTSKKKTSKKRTSKKRTSKKKTSKK